MLKNVCIRYDDPPIPPDPDLGYEGDEGEFWEIFVDLPALPRQGDKMRVYSAAGVVGHGVVKLVEWKIDTKLDADAGQLAITVHLAREGF